MKFHRIDRTKDKDGNLIIVIPKDLGWNEGDVVEIEIEENSIRVKKASSDKV